RLLDAGDHVRLLAQNLVGDDDGALDAQLLQLQADFVDRVVAEHHPRRLVDGKIEVGAVGAHFSSRNCVGTWVAHSTSSLEAFTYLTMVVICPLSSSFFCIIALMGSSSFLITDFQREYSPVMQNGAFCA